MAARVSVPGARDRIRQAAEQSTGEVLRRGRPERAEVATAGEEDGDTGGSGLMSTFDINPQGDRAREAGVGRFTQHRLDRLKREHEPLYEAVRDGHLSVSLKSARRHRRGRRSRRNCTTTVRLVMVEG